MQRLIANVTIMSKPLRYTENRSILNYKQIANITSLNLNSHKLPKQPVPDLKKTAEKYLRSIQPLLNDSEYKNSEKVIQEFIKDNGVGQMLHKKLIDRYQNTDNWMKKWWLQAAYTGYRLPVIVHSSPGTVGPHQKFSKRDDAYTFAARLIFAANQYNNFVKSGKMKQEMARDIPLDMQPYGMILGSYRQPNYEVDNLLHTDDSNHVVILSNNHFFKIMLQNDSGNYLSEEQLAASIKNISERSQSPGKPVGILTGNDRDSWAKDYMKLKDIGSNEKNLKDLETALFVLCIDKEIPPQAFSNKNYESVRAVQSMTGFSSSTNSANRWHDKTVQFIVSYDGFVGMQYEHSPCEGGPIAVLHDYVLNYISSKKDEELKFSENYPKPELLNFEIDEGLEKSIIKATDIVDKISEDIDMECFMFNEFGSNEIKKCKLSPDSFIQIAMQLTYYKLHRKPPAHYESAALRRFINARTECIRSTCNESVNFAKLMLENKESVDIKKDSMLKAINAHKNIANEAANGEGVDRLFFGLKMLAKEEKIELPKFFNDIGYTKSTYFTLTSSQVAYKTASFMCYGPVVPEGYGCCYNPRSKDILFACSSFKDCPDTCSKSFANTLKESLRTMLNLAQS